MLDAHAGAVTILTAENFGQEVERHPGLVLVDFHAEWCGPCHMIAPIVRRLAEEHAGHVKVAKLDVDAAPEVAARYGARSLPTVLLFRDGTVVDAIVGAAPHARYAERIAAQLGGSGS